MAIEGATELHRRFGALLRLPAGMEEQWANAAAPLIASAVPRRTGDTARSVRATSEGVMASGVVNILDAGARAHDIAPRNAKVLKFNARAGGTLFRPKAHKPQQRGQHFKRPAMEEALGEIGPGQIVKTWNGAA